MIDPRAGSTEPDQGTYMRHPEMLMILKMLVILTSACLWLGGCAGGDAEAEAGMAEEPREAAGPTPAAACESVEVDMPLPEEVRETSGLARSARDGHTFWTHNDAGNDPEIFAIDGDGSLIGRVRVAGAQLVDWEDLEAGPCGEEACLYVGDIGDNDADRDRITIYRIHEPRAEDTESAPATALHARFPDGPADAEGLFADASGTLYVVTKGREGEVALYRYPDPHRPGETVMLERVRGLFPEPRKDSDRVTAATSTPDGRWVGIRTYRTLYIYPARRLVTGAPVEPMVVDLSFLAEAQGEALALGDDGRLWVSSEAGDTGPRWSQLRCALPEA